MEVDVIAQYNRDGSIIPMRVRFEDEDGLTQTYTIHGYREVPHSTEKLADGTFVTEGTMVWECRIVVLGVEKVVRLYWSPGRVWRMRA